MKDGQFWIIMQWLSMIAFMLEKGSFRWVFIGQGFMLVGRNKEGDSAGLLDGDEA